MPVALKLPVLIQGRSVEPLFSGLSKKRPAANPAALDLFTVQISPLRSDQAAKTPEGSAPKLFFLRNM